MAQPTEDVKEAEASVAPRRLWRCSNTHEEGGDKFVRSPGNKQSEKDHINAIFYFSVVEMHILPPKQDFCSTLQMQKSIVEVF